MTRCRVGAVAAAAALMVSACASWFDSAKDEYKSASENKLPPLEVPPDLTAPARDDRYQVPGAAQAAATYSAYNAERAGALAAGTLGILPDFGKVRVDRSGNERWLVVPEPSEKVWPALKDFWQKNGFAIKLESPETGIMETDWAQDRARTKPDALAELDKFRTRLERGPQPDTTEIYVSHRGVVEVCKCKPKDTQTWQSRPPDPGLEAEFLRRMMLAFGAQDARARAQLSAEKAEGLARIVQAADGQSTLELAEPFDRAWRRVGLVLDRMGFTVEDRDRSKGYYFVRYVDTEPDASKKDEGALSWLAFWRSGPDPKAAQYRIVVKERKDASDIQVLDKEGSPDRSDTARRILALLQNQLK